MPAFTISLIARLISSSKDEAVTTGVDWYVAQTIDSDLWQRGPDTIFCCIDEAVQRPYEVFCRGDRLLNS
jgi:hypothetical protein